MSRDFLFNYPFKTEGSLYSFGVFDGTSMTKLVNNISFDKAYGFDSFEGIPAELNDPYRHSDWVEGFCDVRDKLNCNKDESIKLVYNKVSQNYPFVDFIVGFYDRVLTDDIVEKYQMKPAKLIEMDCDIYSSAYCALDFMARNKLIVSGTICYYDDYGGSLGNAPEFEGGESRAHKEICEKYKLSASKIATFGQEPPHIQVIFEFN